MTKTNKNTLKNLWKKPLAALLGLSIMASMSTSCIANEKHEQTTAIKKTTKAFTKEDADSYGWLIASVEASWLGIDDKKKLALSYSEEDLKLVRKFTSLCGTKDKRKQLGRIHQKQKANEVLTEEESLIFKDYNLTLAELRKMLKAKKKQINTNLENPVWEAFELGVDWEEILVLTQEETNIVRKLRKIAKEREEEYAAFNDISNDSIHGKEVRSRIFQDYEAKTLSKPEKIALESYYLKVKNRLKEMGSVSKLHAASKKRDENKTETSAADVNADADALYLTHNVRLYHSLDEYTRAVLTAVNSWNGSFDLAPEEEKVIKEADAFYSNEENQKLISSYLKSSAKLSKEEEEASKESGKHMVALSRIKERPNQKTTDKKKETDHGIN